LVAQMQKGNHRLHNNLRNFQFWNACALWFTGTAFAFLLSFLELCR